MIYAPNKFIIGTPTKTGALSALALGRKSKVLKEVPHAHSPYVPHSLRRLDRILLVRNPYDRFISMWKYNRRVNGWQHNTTKDMSFEEYVGWFDKMHAHWMEYSDEWWHEGPRDLRWAPRMWLASLSEFADVFNPKYVVEVADLLDFIESNYPHFIMDIRQMPEVNFNERSAREVTETPRFNHRTLFLLNQTWATRDCDTFGYPLRTRR